MIIKTIVINGEEELRITDGSIASHSVFAQLAKEIEGDTLFAKFYTSGYVEYGLFRPATPGAPYNPLTHKHEDYVWSSRPWIINKYLNLFGTEFELLRSTVGVRKDESDGYMSYGILRKKAEEILKDNPVLRNPERFWERNICNPNEE